MLIVAWTLRDELKILQTTECALLRLRPISPIARRYAACSSLPHEHEPRSGNSEKAIETIRAGRSRSDIEFIARLGVALEEADESSLWLEILSESGLAQGKAVVRLLDEANQLSAIFAQSRITVIERVKRRKESREGRGARVYFKRV